MVIAAESYNDKAARQHLVEAAREGNTDAFDDLFRMYGSRVFNLALRSTRDRALAEDLCQEVWLRVHREIQSLQESEAFAVWLYRLTSRVCIDAARRRRPMAELDDHDAEAAEGRTPENSLLASEDLRLAGRHWACCPHDSTPRSTSGTWSR